MTLSRNRLLNAWPLLIAFAAACGESTPTDPTLSGTETPPATVTATASPLVATAVASTDAAYRWSGSFVVTISNTNLTALTIKSIAADLQQASGGIVIVPPTGSDESFRFDVRAPGNKVEVNGTLAIPFTFYYTLPNGGREALVSLAFNVATDAGASGSVTASVTLQ